ncbi:MAG TPA: triose-phosphate isomerase [Candidatus Saccharimonadales bacterium]|nr:triose-phosphate isomerase [Candidatus Saccharimonadales bacterium]
MRKIMIAANWKMHLNTGQASLLVHRLSENLKSHHDIEVVLAPSMLTLQPLSLQIDRRKFRLAAQNAYFEDEGAFTGEVSFTMLRDLIHYAIVGHSERRRIFNEDLPMIKSKVAAAFRNGIIPILCIGETKHERQSGETKQVLHDQLMTALADLTAEEVEQMVIAYEPVWAISSGSNFAHHEIPKPDEVADVVKYIRSYLHDIFGKKASDEVRILYGGSTVPEVVHGYLNVPGVDGFLVGGASLNYQSFGQIIDSAWRWQRDQEAPDG